jgi:hypothetical protein
VLVGADLEPQLGGVLGDRELPGEQGSVVLAGLQPVGEVGVGAVVEVADAAALPVEGEAEPRE